MSRKSALMLKEGQRRSPRLSGLGICKAQQPTCVDGVGPISLRTKNCGINTRGRKKIKLRPVGEVASYSASKQGGETHSHEDHQSNIGQGFNRSCSTRIPEKCVLEPVLDILQRKDSHEIFSEPVDPNEVEDYYSIIREPMDFGTMRAKLHEGLYRTLEEFEHDVFLITKNAMHFNSSSTIYYREARAIDDLAKKVFHSLKSDPKHFELELLEIRQRSGRRSQVTNPMRRSPSTMAKDGKMKCMKNNMPSKILQYSFEGSSNLAISSLEKPGLSKSATCIDARDHEILPGNRRSKEYHRNTYKPWTSFLNENKLFDSRIRHSNADSLELVTQKDISYRESLMLFVKDLGPRVQVIAKHKLLGWFSDAFCFQATTSPCELQAANPPMFSAEEVYSGHADKNVNSSNVANVDIFCAATRVKSRINDGMENFLEFGTNDVHQSSGHEISFGLKNSRVLGESTSEHCKLTSLEQGRKSSDDRLSYSPLQATSISCTETDDPEWKPCPVYARGDDLNIAKQGPMYGIRCSSEAHQCSQMNQMAMPASQFIFDLSYLEARLSQMNYTAKENGTR